MFQLANGDYEDRSGTRITKQQVVQNYTDDARLQDFLWNSRHHVTPSNFNRKNSIYYKQLFGKDSRLAFKEMIVPKREMDPYDENEVKGTRMPDYSKLTKDRDVYGELGWIDNFNVKCSKHNDKIYPMRREFFDGPKNYHSTYNSSEMTNQEFFRSQAPRGSVASHKTRGKSQQGFFTPGSSAGFKTFARRRGNSVNGHSQF